MKREANNIGKLFRRSVYLLYYLKETDLRQFNQYLRYSSESTGKTRGQILVDILRSVYRNNVSLKDYFCFRFFELDQESRSQWAGTGYMYEYHLAMNPRAYRAVLADKKQFMQHFKAFAKRASATLSELKANAKIAEMMLANSSGRVVLKNSMGQVGAEVEVVSSSEYNVATLVSFMIQKKYDLAEEYIIQHRSLMALSPAGVNTIRILTQLHEGNVYFLGARLRISVNSVVDNLAAGNLAAPIDLSSGIVTGPGVYSDIRKGDRLTHPVTGVEIPGFAVPYWNEVLRVAENAALHTPHTRSVGWDIAITDQGPELIEGNHNWCKLLWQLPVKKGLKKELEKFL